MMPAGFCSMRNLMLKNRFQNLRELKFLQKSVFALLNPAAFHGYLCDVSLLICIIKVKSASLCACTHLHLPDTSSARVAQTYCRVHPVQLVFLIVAMAKSKIAKCYQTRKDKPHPENYSVMRLNIQQWCEGTESAVCVVLVD